MSLREYIEGLNSFAKDNPDALDLIVITSKDAEGNGFSEVYYSPSKGYFDGEDFYTESSFKDHDLVKENTNTVCVN